MYNTLYIVSKDTHLLSAVTRFSLQITSSALSKLLEWFNNEYTLPEIYITENGYADIGEIADNREIVDINRIIYLQRQISQVVEAMRKGINIRGYLIWPLVDDFARYGTNHLNNPLKFQYVIFPER